MSTIKLNHNNVAVPSPRKNQIITLPPFTYPGEPEEDSESGRYFPRIGIILQDVVLTSRTTGSRNTMFQILVKNPLSNGVGSTMPEGIVLDTLVLLPSKRYLHRAWNEVPQPIRVGFHPKNAQAGIQLRPGYQIDSSNWLAIRCIQSGGHEDVVFTFTGLSSGTGWVKP